MTAGEYQWPMCCQCCCQRQQVSYSAPLQLSELQKSIELLTAKVDQLLAADDDPPEWRSVLIRNLNLPTRCRSALEDEGITTLGSLCDKTLDELCDIRKLGQISIAHIVKCVGERGLHLRQVG